jgi:hypothetical protein
MLRLSFKADRGDVLVQKNPPLSDTTFNTIALILALWFITVLFTHPLGVDEIVIPSAAAFILLIVKQWMFKTYCVLKLKPGERMLRIEFRGCNRMEEIDLRTYSTLESVTCNGEAELLLKSHEVEILLAWLFSMTYQRFENPAGDPVDEKLAKWLNVKLVRDYRPVEAVGRQ